MTLINEFGGHDTLAEMRKGHQPPNRKARRKTERDEKKTQSSRLPPPQKRLKVSHTERDLVLKHEESHTFDSAAVLATTDRPHLKSFLKATQGPRKTTQVDSAIKFSSSPLKRVSAITKARLAEDDAEIDALEKKLGIKGRKSIPQTFIDDGLDELLDGLDEASVDIRDSENENLTGREWLARKRKKSDGFEKSSQDFENGILTKLSFLAKGEVAQENQSAEHLLTTDLDTLDHKDDPRSLGYGGGLTSSSLPMNRKRENPYKAPTPESEITYQKYVPPFLLEPLTIGVDDLTRLRKQIKGLVNRLTEANIISIVNDVEKLYRENARQHVTSILGDMLLSSVCHPTSLPDTLIILPAGFVAALYKVIGADFGAHIIQGIVKLFDRHYLQAAEAHSKDPEGANSNNTKETSNLITLLAELYNFQIVGSNLVFDYIRSFLHNLSELHTELLLKIIRTSGLQLRQDDPLSLRDIVAILRPTVTEIGEENISIRTKFMIETINELKNNRIKTGVATSAINSEHIFRMKKILGALNNRRIMASEPMSVGLKDIQESDKKGKWWLVGASWVGDDIDGKDSASSVFEVSHYTATKIARANDVRETDLVQLAREQRMNTEIRRAIFISIMSASDYHDAYLRLFKLKLKKVQELEIPRVLVHCAGAEDRYNPYYTLIARKLCGNKKLKMCFHFIFWDLFKIMNEGLDDVEDTADKGNWGERLETRQLVNIAKMFGSLIADGSLNLTILKNTDLNCLQPKAHTFVEVMLIEVFLQAQRRSEFKKEGHAVINIISYVKETPKLVAGLQHFIRKFVTKTDIAGGKVEASIVKWACKVAYKYLQRVLQ